MRLEEYLREEYQSPDQWMYAGGLLFMRNLVIGFVVYGIVLVMYHGGIAEARAEISSHIYIMKWLFLFVLVPGILILLDSRKHGLTLIKGVGEQSQRNKDNIKELGELFGLTYITVTLLFFIPVYAMYDVLESVQTGQAMLLPIELYIIMPILIIYLVNRTKEKFKKLLEIKWEE